VCRLISESKLYDARDNGELSKEDLEAYAHNLQVFDSIKFKLGNLKKNENFLILGSKSGKFKADVDDLAILPFTDSFLQLMVSASSGWGKSVFLSAVMEQRYLFYEDTVFCIDRKSKSDLTPHKQPLQNLRGLQSIRNLGFAPVGFKNRLVTLKPVSVTRDEFDFEFGIDLEELWEMKDRFIQEEALKRLFQVEEKYAIQASTANYLARVKPKNPYSLMDALSGDIRVSQAVKSRARDFERIAGKNDFKLKDLFLKKQVMSLPDGSERVLPPLVVLQSEEFGSGFEVDFFEFYVHAWVYYLLKTRQLTGLFEWNEEADLQLSSKMLSKILKQKIHKLRASNYSTALSTQSLEFFSKDDNKAIVSSMHALIGVPQGREYNLFKSKSNSPRTSYLLDRFNVSRKQWFFCASKYYPDFDCEFKALASWSDFA